jgi:hypothetical protein
MSICYICGDFSFADLYAMKKAMEKIVTKDPSFGILQTRTGSDFSRQNTSFNGATLASGEAAVVLQGEKEQFVISAQQFLAGVQPS